MATPFSRTRVQSENSPSTLTGYDQFTNPPSVTPSDLTAQTKPSWDVLVMSDIVTRDWKLKQRSGAIINNPMSISRKTFAYGTSSYVIVQTHPLSNTNIHTKSLTGSYSAYLDFHALPVGIPSMESDDTSPVNFDEERLIKLAAIKARTGVSPILVQSLVSAVELPKTLSLISSSLSTLRQIRKSVVTGNPDYAIRAIGNQRARGRIHNRPEFLRKAVHDRWLEFRYGWTPLIFEVQGAIKALNRPSVVNPTRATSRGFENVLLENDSTVFSWVNDPVGTFNYRFFRSLKAEVRAYVLYSADLKHQQARDFGVSELPLAAWELVPFSFVVDWFVNIGNWIEALTPKLGINILAEGYTIKKTTTLKRVVESWTKSTGATRYDFVGSWVGTPDVLTTVLKTRVPHLGVLYSLPPLNVKLDKKRVLDAIALLSKRF